jgi:uncharacterized membrane protein
MDVTNFFSNDQQKAITNAIVEAELNTSGEIRVHIESYCKGDPMKRALSLFHSLEMHKTQHHNGVLFYIALKSHKLAIIGDKAIHHHVKQSFWDEQSANMQALFAQNLYTEALVASILATGVKLKEHFPHEETDINELSDEISFGL